MAVQLLKWNLPEVNNYCLYYNIKRVLNINEQFSVPYRPFGEPGTDYYLLRKIEKTENKFFPVILSFDSKPGDVGIVCKLGNYHLNSFREFCGYDATVINKFLIEELISEAGDFRKHPISLVKGKILIEGGLDENESKKP